MLYWLRGFLFFDSYHKLPPPIMKLSESKSEAAIMQRRNSVMYRDSTASSAAQATGGVLHRIPDINVPMMKISDEYDIEKTISEGCFAKIFLTNHRPTNTTVVLKACHVELMTLKDFIREYHYTYQLSHHPNILSCYQVAFQTDSYYVFAQEYAPFGDLAAHLCPGGLPELFCKSIATQLSAALGFMHSKSLVHRDLKLENVLVFAPDFSRIKLCDFGATTREGTLVSKGRHTWIAFLPPEVLEIVKNERFICKTSSDCWQFGILLFSCLTGNVPWESADWVRDSNYSSFVKYQKKKSTAVPENFRRFTPRLVRAFRKILDPDAEKRAKVTEIMKYMKNKWIDTKVVVSKSAGNLGGGLSDADSVCVYLNQKDSRPSLDENKTRKRLMSSYGLPEQTQADQSALRNRIWEWVLSCEQTYDSEIEGF
ncbi:serine/threonine-protein kinase meng-po [Phlebotomus papatasi]|uniref:serine/threonine-protein kinase meng-po n=1 Tax=Phlebotomus papatasi TaxID=29031 RepID=UPI002483AA4B|nr:serine/threonine-protein kinase meng-po [Phlebotomus papatasi]